MRILWVSVGLMGVGCVTNEMSGGNCPDPEPFEVNETLQETDVQDILGEEWLSGTEITETACESLCVHFVETTNSITVESCSGAWFEGDAEVSGLSLSCEGTTQLMCL